MAWNRDEHRDISDPWRVSLLVRAFVELILVLCVFLCAIISVTTRTLIKASRLLPFYISSHVDKEPGNMPADVKDYEELEFCGQPSNRLASNWSSDKYPDPKSMSIISADYSLSQSACDCTLKRACLVDRSSSRFCSNVVSVNTWYGQSFWPIGDNNGTEKQQESYSLSSENVDSSCDGNELIGVDTTSVSHGCGSERCSGTSSYSPSSGRVLKRKFAKVFPDGSKRSSCHDAAQVAPSIVRKGAAELEERAVGRQRDGPPTQFVSDAGDAQSLGTFDPEESSRDSSQESFSYHGRSSLYFSRSAEDITNRDGEDLSFNVSIDADLLGGETTAEWSGSFASPAHEVEEGSTLEISVMQLREALQEEQEALAALYVELEEERNASSSAANEAMAMITRLQEEKAAIQMEARQYQRMAEEKQLYDQEALATLQEILIKKDEEMYALEEELNLYRKRLLIRKMDELTDHQNMDRVGSPGIGNHVFLIERESLVLEGSEDWKMKMESRDEKLLAEIRDWLDAANEKVMPARVEDVDTLENFQGLSRKISGLPLGNGRKNLLESFSSVAVEESQRGGVLNEDAETRRDAVANHEAVQSMIESLRQEPSLRDEESLETLRKIEEKFQKQSSNEAIMAVEPAASSDRPDQEVITNSDADSSTEEKRVSVQEYVSKFEEQLGNKKPLQTGKSGLPIAESAPVEPPESKGASAESLASDKNRNSPPVGPNFVKTRLRKLAAVARGTDSEVAGDRLAVRGKPSPSTGKAPSTQDARHDRSLDFDEKNNHEGSSAVHDVYEVKEGAHEHEHLTEVTSHDRKENQGRHDIKVENIVQQLEQKLDSMETDRQVMQYTITTLRRENSEMKLLQGIAHQLRELRGLEQSAVSSMDSSKAPDDPAVLPSIKEMLPLDGSHHTVQSQSSKLACPSLGSGDLGACPGDQHVGLCRLLHRLPLSNRLRRARHCKVVEVSNDGGDGLD